jgi:hypothetical protein
MIDLGFYVVLKQISFFSNLKHGVFGFILHRFISSQQYRAPAGIPNIKHFIKILPFNLFSLTKHIENSVK